MPVAAALSYNRRTGHAVEALLSARPRDGAQLTNAGARAYCRRPERFPNFFRTTRIGMKNPTPVFEFGSFVLNPPERQLLREGRPVEMPPKVFDLLLALVRAATCSKKRSCCGLSGKEASSRRGTSTVRFRRCGESWATPLGRVSSSRPSPTAAIASSLPSGSFTRKRLSQARARQA